MIKSKYNSTKLNIRHTICSNTNYRKPIKSKKNSLPNSKNSIEKVGLLSLIGGFAFLSIISLTFVFFPYIFTPSTVAMADSFQSPNVKMIVNFNDCYANCPLK
jgi:hypothetical protein